MIRKLLKNRIILASVLVLVAVTVLSIWQIGRIQKEEGWDRFFAKSLEWVIAPGIYQQIAVVEADGELVFCVEGGAAEEPVAIDENGRHVNLKGMQRMAENGIGYHDAGYGIVNETAADGYSEIWQLVTVDGEVLYDSRNEGFSMTEMPGYIRFSTRGNSRVVSLESGEVVYSAPEGETVSGQKGNYWIMSVTFPWRTEFNTETLYYLRNLDFSVALDGMMFTGISEIEDDMILGKVLEGYDYYGERLVYGKDSPELSVSEKVLDGSGTVLYSPDEIGAGCEITSAGDGWFTTAETCGGARVEKMHFFDSLKDGDALELPEGILPWELYDKGYIQFADSEKTGIMDRKGNVIVPPGFAYVRDLEKDCVVVVLGSECGVIRIGGNRDEG
ncbi:MAG: hypothetical protein IJ443_00515 [Firmicutes bacterium]|nr:hypothetical protein [Bacillota bacterium]